MVGIIFERKVKLMKTAQEFGIPAVTMMQKLGLNQKNIDEIMNDTPKYTTFEKLSLKQQLQAILMSNALESYLEHAVSITGHEKEHFINLLIASDDFNT